MQDKQASPATGPSANAQRSGAGASASSASASLGLAPSPRPAPPTPAAVVPVALAAAPPPPAPAAAADLQPHGTDMDMALERFKAGASGFHGMIDMLVAATEKERQELEEARQQLQEDRRAFEEECRRVQNVLSDVEQVTLNVGGFKFTTSVSTLRNAPSPSLFNAMFSGRHNVVKDAEGCYFIDRDGRHFHDVLNFLRDGAFSCPSEATDFKYLLELRSEANYYGLTGLMQAIDRFPYGQIKVARTTALNMEDSWMYEDGQDEIVFSVDKPVQLLGVGLCGTEGGLTAELELYEVDAEDYSRELGTLASCAQSFTKADGSVLRLTLRDPVCLAPGKLYMLSALIKGAESYCCEECLETVVVGGGITVHFHSWESPNGTNENRGQFPELWIRAM